MIDSLMHQYFGQLDFDTYEGLCTFILGTLVLVGIFNVIKLVIKTIFK